MSSNSDFAETAERLIVDGRVDDARALLDEHLRDVPESWSWLVDRGDEREPLADGVHLESPDVR